MKFDLSDGRLTLFFEGRLDTGNAASVEADIAAISAANPHTALFIDMQDFEYISSSGLRVILRLAKREKNLEIINVSPDVYDVFEMTGFAEMLTIRKAFRRLSVEGCEVIGRGAKGVVYRYDPETIVKVYKNPDSLDDIMNERQLAKRAFVLGVPTAISYDVVKVGDSYGSVFELLNAKSFSKCIANEPEKLDFFCKESADLLRQIHETPVKPGDMPDIKLRILGWVKDMQGQLADDEVEKLRNMVNAVEDTHTMIHGDYHTNNIMWQNNETLLIDMDTLSHGHPVFELANVYITYVGFGEVDPSFVADFMGLPYSTCVEFMDRFWRYYFQTEDSAFIEKALKPVKLLSYVRYLRFTRKHYKGTDTDNKIIALCKQKISELLKETDSLVW